MALRLLCHLPLEVLVPTWLLLLCAADAAGQVFVEEPSDISVVIGEPGSFRCRVNPEHLMSSMSRNENTATWYRIKEGAKEITHSSEGRFFVVGAHEEGIFDLYINYTTSDDSGSTFLCVFNKTATRAAALNLLPESWRPTCLRYPDTEVKIGQELRIVCTSEGDERTDLLWQRNGALLEPVDWIVIDKTVSLSYSEQVTRQEIIQFTCSASIGGLEESSVCTIGPIEVTGASNNRSYIPYIIVGLLSVVVSLLFLTLLVVLFRHRQCRMCQRELPEPQTVLDMAQIQLGGRPPFYAIHGDDASLDDGIGSSPPPDVIPTTTVAPVVAVSNQRKTKGRAVNRSTKHPNPKSLHPPSRTLTAPSKSGRNRPPPRQSSGPSLRRTSSNTTLQGNIDDPSSKDKTVTGKTKLAATNFGKSSSRTDPNRHKKYIEQSTSHPHARALKLSPNKHSEDDTKSQKQLNIDHSKRTSSKAVPTTSNIATEVQSTNNISSDTAVVSSADHSTLNMNNLGDINIDDEAGATSGGERRSRYEKNVELTSRRGSQELNNRSELYHLQVASESPDLAAATLSGPRNDSDKAETSTTSAGTTVNQDKVIYAELDFQKPIGLNIEPEV